MAKDERKEVVIKDEMRTKEISKMINEGGLGADKYYDIKKKEQGEKAEQEAEHGK